MKYVEGSKKVFMNTGTRFPRELIWSAALVKRSSAKVNVKLDLINPEIGEAIVKASDEVMQGLHDDKVVVDVFQTGSGTGLNMNLNELIAERASELLGKSVHPNDHVNLCQSSNDVSPAAIRIAAASSLDERLKPSLSKIARSLVRLSSKTSGVYKAGRTHLRDALPVTMGQEFLAYADAFSHDLSNIEVAQTTLLELPLGGTAVGTGMNSHPEFGKLVTREIANSTGLGFKQARSTFRAMKLLTDMALVSSVMKIVALDLYRLCQDIRLMFSGPFTGVGEIDIPTQEEVAGSSIMPGKTNPVTVEAALLVCSQVIGLDSANQTDAMLGEFELSMGVPLMGYNIELQIRLLSEALEKMSTIVVDHITPLQKRARHFAESSPALVTILSPRIGYDKAAKLGKKLAKGLSIGDALKEMGYTDAQITKLLDMRKLVKPGFPAKEK